MGLFSKKPAPVNEVAPAPAAAAPVAAPASSGISLEKRSGSISLKKGEGVSIAKTAVIKATCSWSSQTDYDLYALVLTRDGQVHTVATFGTENDRYPTTSVLNGAVKHLGDITRGAKDGSAQETIEITLTPDIVAVVPVAYSAQSNGTGSFKQYGVSLGIDNGEGTRVTIDSNTKNKDAAERTVYTVAIGIIRNEADGVTIQSLEQYSRPGSEYRPVLRPDGTVSMDAGSRNLFK